MPYKPFEVPEYHEFFDALGVGPEPIEGEDAHVLHFELDSEVMALTFDIPGRSVNCKWSSGPRVFVDVFREAAARIRVRSSATSTVIVVDFESDDLRGKLEVQVSPSFALNDQLLFH